MEEYNKDLIIKTTWCYLWSYDNFKFEYEESDKEFNTLQECIKAMWEDRKTNIELSKGEWAEPKTYYMFRKKELQKDPNQKTDIEWCSDYSWTRRKNKIYLHRKDIL